jgi:hypothetical protein
MYHAPDYVWALVLIGVIGIPAITVVVLYRAAVSAQIDRRAATGLAIGAAALFGGWIAGSSMLAHAGLYRQSSGTARPWLGLAFAGSLIAALLACRIPVRIADPWWHVVAAAR